MRLYCHWNGHHATSVRHAQCYQDLQERDIKRWNHELLLTNSIKAKQRVARVMKLHSRNIKKTRK